MCFQNLPIEFDNEGRPRLLGSADAFAYTPVEIDRSQIEELVKRNAHVRDIDIDPVTRVAGALAFHAVVDLQSRTVKEANSVASLFRGYEVILKGRDPRDAMFISSRVCGVCGGVHSVASSLAIEMAFGITPPPMGLALRNIQLALDFMLDNPLHLYVLAGPDYSQVVVERTNPALWARAQRTEAPHADVHQYRTIADIMRALNPLTGKLYLEGLHATRGPREAYAVLYGKYPHPQTVVPGGLSTTVSLKELNETHNRIIRVIDHGKRGVFVWEDLTAFFYEGWENEGVRFRTDPAGNPLSPHHPWNKETKPKPTEKRSWKERYTWDTAPRWDRQVMECGTYARMWTTAAAQKLPHTRFIQATGTSLKLDVPQTLLPAMELEWKIPEVWNAFERNRNRAYHILYSMLVAYENLLIAFDLMKQGHTRTATPYQIPRDQRIGVGFWGAGRGWLTHHLVMDKGALVNYQIVTPSTWNASPKDPWGNGGAYEEAVTNTPILEEYDKPEQF